MKKSVTILLALSGALAAVMPAHAAGAAPVIYGPIDTARFPKPLLINRKPVLIDKAAAKASSAKPLYLHVAPGEEWHWYANCRKYNACGVPVHFVSENWFAKVYLPAIGSRDGREQQYQIDAARERTYERDYHDAHGHD
jgi:hypothetical protein